MAGAKGGLVGRDSELGMLRGMVAQLVAGRGGVVWMDGEPGIGKSALIDAAEGEAQAAGVRVFRAAADELTQPFALRLAADCLAVTAAEADQHRAEIIELLAGCGGAVDAVSAAAERLLALVDRECARSAVMLVGDDLQWADEASVRVWSRLISATQQQPLLLAAVCRPVPRRAELNLLREAMQRRAGAVALTLGPLSPDQVAAMARQTLSARPGPGLTSLLDRAAGNPLYLRETLDVLIRDGSVHTADGLAEVAEAMSELSLGAAIGRRLGFLSESTRTSLRAAAVLDNRFTVGDWALVADRTVPQLADVTNEALVAGVLAEVDTALTFRHPLIRQALRDELPEPLRTRLHAHASKKLALAGMSWDRVARHLLAAPDAIDDWALEWLTTVPAEALYARPTSSVQLLESARLRTSASDPRHALLMTRLISALRLLARADELIKLGSEALRTVTDPAMFGEIAYGVSRGYHQKGRVAEAAAMLTDVLDGTIDPGAPWRSRLRAQLASTLFFCGEDAESRLQAKQTSGTLAQQAISEGERDEDPLSVGIGLMALAYGLGPANPAALDLLDRVVRVVVGDDTQSTNLRLQARVNRLTTLGNLDESARWAAELPSVIVAAERAGGPVLAQANYAAAELYLEQGDWDQAGLYLEQISDADVFPQIRLTAAALAARIALCRGDRPAAVRYMAGVDDPSASAVQRAFTPAMTRVSALLAEADDQLERAAALLAELLGRWHADWHERDFYPEVVRLALAVGDTGTASRSVEAAQHVAKANPIPGLAVVASICRAMLEDDAAALLDAAVHLERVGRRPLQAFTLQEAAVRLAQRGDVPAARAAFAQAVGIYDRLGSILDLRRVQARLRPYGIRRGSRGARQQAFAGWDALTPAERTVASLVGRGESNPEIAAELFLSRRTVEVHIGHILHKLGVRSRIEIAQELIRHDPGRTTQSGRATDR